MPEGLSPLPHKPPFMAPVQTFHLTLSCVLSLSLPDLAL